jgi:hypothetical protein
MKYTSLILSIVLCWGAWPTTQTFSTAPAKASILTELEGKLGDWVSSDLSKKIDSVILLFLNDKAKDQWKTIHDELKRQLSTVSQNQINITKDASDTCQNIECLLLALHADIVTKSATKDTVYNALSSWAIKQDVDLTGSGEHIVKKLHDMNFQSFKAKTTNSGQKDSDKFLFFKYLLNKKMIGELNYLEIKEKETEIFGKYKEKWKDIKSWADLKKEFDELLRGARVSYDWTKEKTETKEKEGDTTNKASNRKQDKKQKRAMRLWAKKRGEANKKKKMRRKNRGKKR